MSCTVLLSPQIVSNTKRKRISNRVFEAMASFRLENTFGQKLDKINLDESTLDQLNWMSWVLDELKFYESTGYHLQGHLLLSYMKVEY